MTTATTLPGSQGMPDAPITQWRLTEDTRYWRVVEVAEDRRRNAWPGTAELFRYHSISCVCEDCLDTDTVFYAYDNTDQIDLTGIR